MTDMEKPDLYVVARFLERLAERGTYGKTDLQLAVRVNYGIYQRYLAWLVAHGFVATDTDDSGREHVVLTTKGRDAHERLVGWIRDVMGDRRL